MQLEEGFRGRIHQETKQTEPYRAALLPPAKTFRTGLADADRAHSLFKPRQILLFSLETLTDDRYLPVTREGRGEGEAGQMLLFCLPH
jgi:hypothetical protein